MNSQGGQNIVHGPLPVDVRHQNTDDAAFTNLFEDLALVKKHLDCLGLPYDANIIADLLLEYNGGERVYLVVNRILDEPSVAEIPKAPVKQPVDKKEEKRNETTMLVDIFPGDEEFLEVQKQLQTSSRQPGHARGVASAFKIIRLQKIQNCKLWEKYCRRKEEVSEENNNEPNEYMLFHGSRTSTNAIIEKGFDERYANVGGSYGAGIYFAEHSAKSNNYVYGINGGCPMHKNGACNCRNLLLCRVTLGKSFTQNGSNNQMAHAPPGHHSVIGAATGPYPEYIIYRGEQAYPEYLITYQ